MIRYGKATFQAESLYWLCTCAVSSNESSYAAWVQWALELGLSELQLNRGGLEVGSANRNRRGATSVSRGRN
jgi:hypothetical protein